MALQLVMLKRPPPRHNMMKNRRRNNSFRIRQRASRVFRARSWNSATGPNQDKRECNQTPTVVFDVV